jgi:hypothetical protein
MPLVPPILLRVRRRPRRRTRGEGGQPSPPSPPPPPPPAVLVLVSATYDVSTPSVRLTFDRAISLAGFDGAAVVVDDAADSGNQYQGTGGAFLVTPQSVEIFLVDPATATGTGTTLTVTAANGIVASVPPAGTWPGVLDLPLPFP